MGVDHTDLRNLFSEERLGGRTLDEHLLYFIAPRPRDAIHFLAECIENALTRGHDKLEKSDVEDAEARYSSWRRQVIIEEGRYGAIDPEVLLNSFAAKTARYSSRELARHLDQLKRDAAITVTKPRLIESLVEWGVLGVQGKSKGARYVWDSPAGQWIGPSDNDGDDNGEVWTVHHALWRALNIKRPAAGRTKPALAAFNT